jgi:capsular polysaccharide biosynthesis protein
MLKKLLREFIRPIRRYLFKKLQHNLQATDDTSLIKYINIISQKEQKLETFTIEWLDTKQQNQLQILNPEQQTYSYPPQDMNSYNEFSKKLVIAPSVVSYHFNDAIVNIASSSFLYDNTIIIEKIPNINPHNCNYSSGFLLQHNEKHGLISINLASNAIENGIFIGGNGSWNYYHWMIEILVKLQFIEKLPNKFHKYPLLLSEEVQKIPSFIESLNLLNSQSPRIFLKNKQCYKIKNLIYISSPNNLLFNSKNDTKQTPMFNYFRSESILFLRQNFLKNCTKNIDEGKYPKKLFLARKNNRRQYNQDSIFSLIEPFGFTKCFMEDYSLCEQINLFKFATHILGPTGAAWTNLIFCQKTVKCLCWMPKEIGDFSAFSTLAKICDIDLCYIIFESNIKHNMLNSQSYTIDPKSIQKWLELNLKLIK